MKRVSILNHVIGPIMRGPSSSHTAGPWRIGRIARDLLSSRPVGARCAIHPTSSLSVCYHDQGSDLALVSGLLGILLTDDRFPKMLDLAPALGLQARFELTPFPEADHPNSMRILLQGENGENVALHARSVGGGSIEIASVDGHPLMIRATGTCFSLKPHWTILPNPSSHCSGTGIPKRKSVSTHPAVFSTHPLARNRLKRCLKTSGALPA